MRLFRKPSRRRSFSQREMFQFEALEQRILLTNTAPNAVDDQYGVLHDFPLVVEAAYGVLSNDWDDDFDFLTASLDTGPQNGTLHFLNADGSFYYEPDYRFVGVDSFTYTVSDGQDTATATVTINVGNTPPVANDDTYDVLRGWPLITQPTSGDGLLDNDYDPDVDGLTATLVSGPQNGSFDYFQSDGHFSYTADPGFVGTDTFTYSVTDGIDTETATATIHVVNLPPIAEAGGPYAVPLGGSVQLDGTQSYDPNGDSLTYEWDLDDDGTADFTGAQPTIDWEDLLELGYQAGSTVTVSLTVSDGIAEDTDEATLTIEDLLFSVNRGFADPNDGGNVEIPHCPECTQLAYFSEGNPHPIMQFVVGLPSASFTGYFTSELSVSGGSVGAAKTYTIQSGQAGKSVRMASQFDASAYATGFHDFEMKLTARAADGTLLKSQSVIDRVAVVNRIDSEYGNRWWLPFLDRLDVDEATTGGVGLIRGDGTADFFTGTGGTYSAPSDIFETLTKTATGYTLVSPQGWTKHFDAAGLLTRTTDRNGRVLQAFGYTDADSDGLVDELATFTQADGHVATYTYDTNGRITQSDNGRGATYHYDFNADGTLASTSSPPLSPGGPAPTIQYGYDPATKLMLTKTDVRGLVTTFTYGDDLRIRTIDTPQAGIATVSPSQVVGLDEFVLSSDVASTQSIAGVSVSRIIDALGYVSEMTDGNGNVVEFTRDGRGLVTSIIQADPANPASPLLTGLDFNSQGMATRVDNPDGTYTEMTYAANGIDLLSFRDERGEVWTYTVDATGNRLTATDPLGNVTSFTYDAHGNLESVTTPDPDGAGPLSASVTQFEYDTVHRLTKVTNPDLTVRSYTYDVVSGNIATETDELGGVTSFGYDVMGRLTSLTLPDPDGAGPQSAPVWTYTYCGCGSLTSMIDPLGNTTSYTYDASTGLLESISSPDPDGAGPLPALVTSYQYDDLGRVIAEIAPGNRITSYEYDNNGNLIKLTLPDPDGDSNFGDPASVWEYGYDSLNRQIWSEDPYDERTTFSYDARSRLRTVTDATGYVSTYFYTPDGQLLQSGAPKQSGSLLNPGPLTEFAYDDAGRLTSVADPLGNVMAYAYDAIGRLISQTSPDPDGAGPRTSPVTHYAYDSMGRILTETDALNNVTTYAYDDAGNLLSLTDASGNATNWVYDLLGRTVSQTNELNISKFFEYDPLGNLTKITDGMDRVTEYAYDNLSRLISESWFTPLVGGGYALANTITHTFDAWGRLDGIEDQHSKYDLEYDHLDRLVGMDNLGNPLGVPRAKLINGFDLLGRRTSLAITDPANAAQNDFHNGYAYDAAGRMTRITQSGQAGGRSVSEKRVDLTYDGLGRIDQISRYADLLATKHVATSDYDFDDAGRLTSLAHAAGGVVLASYAYVYDNLGRLLQETSVDGVKNHDYDSLGQLTGVSGASSESYAYDETGNRIGANIVTGANNQLLEDADHTYQYDAAGNRVRRTEKVTGDYQTYAWDHRNRLVAVSFHDASDTLTRLIEYRYDVFDNLIARLDNTDGVGAIEETRFYIHDPAPGKGGLDDLVLDYDGAGNVVHRYLHGAGIDQLFADEDALNEILWSLSDRQGTIRDWAEYDELTDTTTVANHVVFDGFGKITSQTDPNQEVTIGYTGRFIDSATGLQWNRARWYDPSTGRWMGEDPIGFAGGQANLSAYVGNSPTNGVDPSGLRDPVVRPELKSGGGLGGPRYGGGGVNPSKVSWKTWFPKQSSTPTVTPPVIPQTPARLPLGPPTPPGYRPPGQLPTKPVVCPKPNTACPTNIHSGKQGKHIPGHNNYDPARDPLTFPNPQALIDRFAGTGTPVGNVPRGAPGFKERVDFGQIIGTNRGVPTTKGIIHYSNSGLHIVPARP